MKLKPWPSTTKALIVYIIALTLFSTILIFEPNNKLAAAYHWTLTGILIMGYIRRS